MGTNYYANFDICQTCGKAIEEMHIGKDSFGWQFHFYGEKMGIVSKKQWEEVTKQDNVVIKDEYDEIIEHEEFWKLVEEKQKNISCKNHYRVVMNLPETEKEQAYLDNRNYFYDKQYNKHMWIDKEGYSFDDHEFS